jgi:DNA-binding NarL/FixJ family response regulator
MVKILLIDSPSPFREAIKELLFEQIDFDLAGVGNDGYDAIKLTEKLMPDVVVLGIESPLFDEFKAVASIRPRCPSCAIIICAAKMDDKTIFDAVRCGVTGFVLRGSMYMDICRAIRNVSAGSSYMSRAVALRIFEVFSLIVKKQYEERPSGLPSGENGFSSLNITRAEMQVAAFIAKGFSNKQIAEILKLKEGTIRNYISLILQKMNLKHRTQIAVYALNNDFHNRLQDGGMELTPRTALSP